MHGGTQSQHALSDACTVNGGACSRKGTPIQLLTDMRASHAANETQSGKLPGLEAWAEGEPRKQRRGSGIMRASQGPGLHEAGDVTSDAIVNGPPGTRS